MLFKADLAIEAATAITERTIKVGQAFGIGIEPKQTFQIFHDFKVDIRPGDIIYITGDSGGGKSTLLKLIGSWVQIPPNRPVFGKVCSFEDLSIDPEEILVEDAGKTFEQALRNLSQAGLGEAFLFVRRYKQLSDGQKYRYRLARLLAEKPDTILVDEFASTLDRDTAKILAFTLQKYARQNRKTLIVATAHRDLEQDLAPSVLIEKGFGSHAVIRYCSNSLNTRCSLLEQITIQEATLQACKSLEQFHYRASLPNVAVKTYTISLGKELAGCIVYQTSLPAGSARRFALGYAPTIEELNKDFARISRVIIHPKFRSLGLGVKLVKETLPKVGKKYIEIIAVMANYNPVFEKAGMKRINLPWRMDRDYAKLLQALKVIGVDHRLIQSTSYLTEKLRKASKEEYENIVRTLLQGGAISMITKHQPKAREESAKHLQRIEVLVHTIQSIARMMEPKAYLIWKNPEVA